MHNLYSKKKKLAKHKSYNSDLNKKFYESDPFIGSFNKLNHTQYGFNGKKITNPTRYYLLHESQLKTIKCFIEESKNKKILDLGCGDGTLVEYLKEFDSYLGVDISPTRINRCKKKFNSSKIEFLQHDIAASFPFESNTFDIVVASEIIEHVPNPIFFIQECNRVLNNDGILILSTPLSRTYIKQINNLYHEQHLYQYSLRQVISEIQENGFKVKEKKGIGFHFDKVVFNATNPILWFVFYLLKFRKPKLSQYERYLNISILDNPSLNKEYFNAKKNTLKKFIWFTKLHLLNTIGHIFPQFSEQIVIKANKHD